MEFELGSLTKVEREIYQEAAQQLEEGIGAVDLSAHFFGPGGRFAKLAKSRKEREKLVESDLYKWLQNQVARLRRRESTRFKREIASLSGRLTVIVPKSLHAALKKEAASEGVSLSELMRLKLNVPYQQILYWMVS